MTYDVFKWLLTAASLVGVVLNIQHNRASFGIWFFTNVSWACVSVSAGLYQRAFLDAVYAGLSVWGLMKWKSRLTSEPD